MTLRPTPEATYILAAPRRKAQRGTRKPDPWRYLKRLGDIDEARRRLAELEARGLLELAAEEAFARLPRFRRWWLAFRAVDPLTWYLEKKS